MKAYRLQSKPLISHFTLYKKKRIRYTVLQTGELPPEKLQEIYKQSKHDPPLTQDEREQFEKEWLSLSNSQETLRIWRNGTIQSVSENYYDEFIINRAKKLHGKQKKIEFIKAARLIGEIIGHLEQFVGDPFIEYRLKKLRSSRVFEAEEALKR